MKLTVLDTKTEGDAVCYLCKIDLIDYINGIPQDYLKWDIQRGVVRNGYLDSLANTIANKVHIPAIVLTANNINIVNKSIEIFDFKILDGLQRTHRLKVISDSIKLIQNDELFLSENNASKYARKRMKEIKSIGSNSSLIKYLLGLGLNDKKNYDVFISNNSLWIEVWSGLNDNQKIKKMLMLNAGHKSVSIKHQLELLFSGVYLDFEKILPSKITIQREKDQSSIQYSKSRVVGVYNFAHIISALISLSACKAVNTNSDFISEIQSGEISDIDLFDGFDIEMLEVFIELLYSLDKELFNQYDDKGVKWLGREVVLVGMFGAIGTVAKSKNIDIKKYLKFLTINIEEIVKKLGLSDFEKIRNNVEFSKVNIGNVNKNAVYKAFSDILEFNDFKSWGVYFGVDK